MTTTTNNNDRGTAGGAIDRDVQDRLGEKLKDAYGEVLNEPVPDRFVALLDKLSDDGKAGDAGDPSDPHSTIEKTNGTQ